MALIISAIPLVGNCMVTIEQLPNALPVQKIEKFYSPYWTSA